MKMLRYLTLATLAALLGLGSAGGYLSVGGGTLVQAQGQAECTVTVQPGESIQQAIDQTQEGAVICLVEGMYEENIKIEKSLTLRGMSAEQTVIDGVEEGYPVVWITTTEETQTVSVKVKGLRITGAEDSEAWHGCTDRDKRICPDGVLIQGSIQAELTASTVSKNEDQGIVLMESARATISSSTISENEGSGILMKDSARVTLENSIISKNWDGLSVEGSATVSLINSTVSDNRGDGLEVKESANVSLENSTISGNGYDGISLKDSAQAVITNSIISENRWDGIRLQRPPFPETSSRIIKHVEFILLQLQAL